MTNLSAQADVACGTGMNSRSRRKERSMRTRFVFFVLLLTGGALQGARMTATADAAQKSDAYDTMLIKIGHIPVSQLPDALPAIEEAINTAPERYEAYYYAGYALYRASRLDEAAARAKEAQTRIHDGGGPLVERLLHIIAYRKTHPGKDAPRVRSRALYRQVPGGYTAILIDARGLGVERGMAPKIRRVDGLEVWGTKEVDPDYVIDEGIVVYGKTVEAVKQNKRCGPNPLIFRAIKPQVKVGPGDACLTGIDARALINMDKKYHYLDNNRVIFLVDN